MGEKRPQSAFGVVAGLSVTVCLMAAGCAPARPADEGEAIAASANLSSDRSLAASDTAPDVSDTPLSDPVGISELEAVVVPPTGWLPDPVKRSRNHAHQAWLSPTGSTAYGVIRMNLPLPFIGPDVVLPRFLEQMRQTEGAATLLSRR